MPRHDPPLPEASGTDVAVRPAGDRPGTDKLVGQVRDQVSTLRGQASGKIRTFADDGKAKATGLLDDFSGVIADAARSVDEKFGEDYGEYAHRAAGAVSGFAGRMREKSVDDIVDDAKAFVRKSPGIAIGIAAVAGFALMRVIKTGLDDVGGRPADDDSDRSGA